MYCGTSLQPPSTEVSRTETGGDTTVNNPLRTTLSTRMIVALIIVAIAVIVVASTFAYLFQPIRGRGSVSATEVLLGANVQFDFIPTQGVGAFEYEWSFGDGGSSTEKNPTHTYSSTGTYTARVTVTNWVGLEYTWSTIITVRSSLVFIDSVYYPSYFESLTGDTAIRLYLDGALVSPSVAVVPGTSHLVRLQIIWIIEFGPLYNEDIVVDDSGTITAQNTSSDLHCDLHYNPWEDPKFTLIAR